MSKAKKVLLIWITFFALVLGSSAWLACFFSKELEPAEPTICYELLDGVDDIKTKLPILVYDGMYLIDANYDNTEFSLTYEMEEQKYDFADYVKDRDRMKEFLLHSISASGDDLRPYYELCVSHNISISHIYRGKQSLKELTITATPKEIQEALQNQITPMQLLKHEIESVNKELPQKQYEGFTFSEMQLKDSMLYLVFTYDDNIIQLSDILEDPKSAKENLRRTWKEDGDNTRLIHLVANAHCGLVYSNVALSTSKEFNIVFSPREISNLDKYLRKKFVEKDRLLQ